jgi:sugar phosphate isomerase/epimerase
VSRLPIGVFASLGEGLGASLDAVRRLGVTTVHLGAPRDRAGRSRPADVRKTFADAGIEVTVLFCGFPGSSYETIEAVEQTVGLAPATTREARVTETFEMADFARDLGCDAIGMHLGVIPSDAANPLYESLVDATRRVCDHCAGAAQRFHLETGQETAEELLRFVDAVGRDNLAVNFDPANMILYGTGEPLPALETLGPLVKSVHCKDAKRDREPRQKWYEDCPLGEGDVGIEAFVATLLRIGYSGPLTIEREYSPDQEGDLAQAVRLLEEIKSRLVGSAGS